MLYNSQIRSIMEYAPLVWSSCPPSYLKLLDKIQERVSRLIDTKRPQDNPVALQTLQHRRAVSGLSVFYKVQVAHCHHLSGLRLPTVRVVPYQTRNVASTGREVQVPFAHTSLYQRSYHPYYARMWNKITNVFVSHDVRSLKNFKEIINKRLLHDPRLLEPLII